jgi:hypothetical protein
MKINYHLHHIVPKHAGGTDDPSNLVRVNVAMHAFLHKLRYEETGDKWDKIAYEALGGQITRAEAAAEARREFTLQNPNHHSNAGKKGGKAPASVKAKNTARELAAKLGKLPWWNNGLTNKRSNTCPDKGYVLGKLPCDTHSMIKKVLCPHCHLMCSPQNLSRHILSRHT